MNVKWWHAVVASTALVGVMWLSMAYTIDAPIPIAKTNRVRDWDALIYVFTCMSIFAYLRFWSLLIDIRSELRGIRRALSGTGLRR